MKKDSVKTKYDKLVKTVSDFTNKVNKRRSLTAFFYKASEEPQPLVANAPPQQFNVLEVRQLISHVLTAEKLGYHTMLTADAGELFINFVENYPSLPHDFFIVGK